MQPLSFFWQEKQAKNRVRSRFNLLLLEYGEYFLQDYSAYSFPLPRYDRPFPQCDNLKVQGRLKLCSRSLMFEPTDIRLPIVRFPYRNFMTRVMPYELGAREKGQCSLDVSGFFAFDCHTILELKANDKVGPYRVVDCNERADGAEFLFALVHTELSAFLGKVQQLRDIAAKSDRLGPGAAVEALKPMVNLWNQKFDTSQLVDFHEDLLLPEPVFVNRVKPLVHNPGCLMITNARIYFQPADLNNVGEPTISFSLRNISRMYKRRHLLRQIGLELFMQDGTSVLFSFETSAMQSHVYSILKSHPDLAHLSNTSIEDVTRKWQEGKVSNFEYLMYLNNEADRSVNDLAQYPVFPWVIKDYTSRKLDLQNPATYRDLSKPIGALNEERLEYILERFHSMPPCDPDMGIPPPFMYGTHYSTPGYVLFYLVRVAPEYMLCLQSGKFDAPDRMFISMEETWESCLNNPADLKELIPEFYCGDGEFLNNMDDLDLGHRQNGEKLDDVILPPWARNARDFVDKCAQALEGKYVSDHLHEWIDLIFGYKQQGEEAEKANNLFYYLTYEGAVDLEQIPDPRQRNAIEVQVQEFGQTPKQLFAGPHPARHAKSDPVVLAPSGRRSSFPPTPVRHLPQFDDDTTPLPAEESLPADDAASDAAAETAPALRRIDTHELGLSPAGVVKLGEDFREEVARMQEAITVLRSPHAMSTNGGGRSPSSDAAASSASTMFPPVDMRKIRLQEGAPFQTNQEAVTCVTFAPPATICFSSRDSTLKVLHLELETDGTLRMQLHRNFACSGQLSACGLPTDAKFVIGASWDNNAYSYSVPNACAIGKVNAHDDGVTDLQLSADGTRLVTGAWDAIVKVWEVERGRIHSNPLVEFYDHENLVRSVAMDHTMSYVAGGADDGTLIAWDIHSESILFNVTASLTGRAVMSVQWMPLAAPTLLCSTADGLIRIYDLEGVPIAWIQLDTCVNKLCFDGRAIFGACKDGSIRVWILDGVDIVEVYRHENAHRGQVTAIAVNAEGEVVITGGEDGSVKAWKAQFG